MAHGEGEVIAGYTFYMGCMTLNIPYIYVIAFIDHTIDFHSSDAFFAHPVCGKKASLYYCSLTYAIRLAQKLHLVSRQQTSP